MKRLVVFIVAYIAWLPAVAEVSGTIDVVCVKYGPCPLELSAFDCADTPQSSFVRRICYDAPKRFMVIKLNDTWYPYCEINAEAFQALLAAPSVGGHYNEHIRSKRDGAHGPFDCRDHPMPRY